MYFLELVLLLATILIQKECFAGDGSFKLHDGWNHLTEYYAKDQCMAQPGYFHLHHFSLAFYLQEHQICGGGPEGMDGLLICYRSQLEKSALLPMGMQPTRQYELRNLAGNGVTEQCKELAGPDWHGILINTNDQRNWVFRFSTTNRTFTIDNGMHILEWLFYKLASAKDLGESFLSKTFDPYRDFMKWNNDHFGEAEEADNRIRHMDNEKLKGLFMERQAMQERLQNYAGIWSLGLDMLPTKEGIDHFDIIVKISKCCQAIQAFFNQPTAQVPKQILPNKVNFTVRPFPENVAIYENFTITLNGIINPDAERMKFEIVDQLDHGYMRFIVDFEKNSITFEGKIELPDSIPMNHFARGAPFNLVVILSKNGMSVNVNCNGPQNINAEIAFENPHYINIIGDYKYINADLGDASASSAAAKSWMVEGEGLHGENSGGIMLQGKISENAQKFTIKLWHRNDDGSYESILAFEVGIESKDYKLLIGSKNEGCTQDKCDLKEVAHSYNSGSPFEAIFKFSVKSNKIEIWMNNSLIGDLQIDPFANNNIVHFVQIVGDATANLIEIRKNWVSCTYEMSSKEQKSFNVVGKMLPHKDIPYSGLNIQLMDARNQIHIDMEFLIEEFSTDLRIVESFDEKPINNGSFYDQIPIKKGDIFHLDIHYKNEKQIGLTINEELPEIVFIANVLLSETKCIRISDSVPIDGIPNEGFVILKMDMTKKCKNI